MDLYKYLPVNNIIDWDLIEKALLTPPPNLPTGVPHSWSRAGIRCYHTDSGTRGCCHLDEDRCSIRPACTGRWFHSLQPMVSLFQDPLCEPDPTAIAGYWVCQDGTLHCVDAAAATLALHPVQEYQASDRNNLNEHPMRGSSLLLQ